MFSKINANLFPRSRRQWQRREVSLSYNYSSSGRFGLPLGYCILLEGNLMLPGWRGHLVPERSYSPVTFTRDHSSSVYPSYCCPTLYLNIQKYCVYLSISVSHHQFALFTHGHSGPHSKYLQAFPIQFTAVGTGFNFASGGRGIQKCFRGLDNHLEARRKL